MASIFRLQVIVSVAIVCIAVQSTGTASTITASMPIRMTDTQNDAQNPVYSRYRNNMAPEITRYDSRQISLREQTPTMIREPLQRYALKYNSASGERRSYSADSSSYSETYPEGLTRVPGMGHISNGYASVAPTHTEALEASASKKDIPIYEDQHEDAAVAAVAAAATDYGPHGPGQSNYGGVDEIQHSSVGSHPANYKFPSVGRDHSTPYLTKFIGGDSSWTLSKFGQYSGEIGSEQAVGNNYAYDKISVENLLNPGYGAFQEHQQPPEEQHQQNISPDASSAALSGSDSAVNGPSDYEHLSSGEEHSHFLPESNGHYEGNEHSQRSHHHVDIINYVPVQHVKKQHVPVEKTVKIPISHAVIIPIKKPVPIHIPITKQVQVAVEKELKVPVERIVPVPVEKHFPVPVEKRVPYTVIKYLPIKVPRPFPVKVPVFKTVLHKVKSWW